MKNAVINLSFLLLCIILGMMIYVYYPRVSDKQDEIQLRQAVIDSLKSDTNMAREMLRIREGEIEILKETIE